MLPAVALLWLAAAQADASTQARALLQAWRSEPGAAAVATRVSVRDGDREGTAVAEPCVVAWDASVPRVALRRGALTVVMEGGRLLAAHAEGDAAVDRPVSDAARAWAGCFAEMPWPQPELALLPVDSALVKFDAEMGDLQVQSVEADASDPALVTVRLKAAHGSWRLAFRGGTCTRLVSAERTLDGGPRVPKGASITWSTRFEPIEPESGLWKPPVEGRRRVDRVEDVVPRQPERVETPSTVTPPKESAPDADTMPTKP